VPVLEPHRVVIGHHAQVLHAQDRRHVEADPHLPVRVAGVPRRHAEHPVVLVQQPAVEQGVGLDDSPYPRQTHLLDHPVLGGLERPLHPPFGLGAARQDQVNGQLAKRPAELRLRIGYGLAPVVDLEDAVPVGVQGQGAAVGSQPALEQVEVVDDRVGVVEPRRQAAGGVVDHVDQHHALAAPLGPVVDRGVHLHQLAEAGAARPAAAVLFASPLGPPESFGHQPAPQGVGGDPQAAFGQLLGGEGGAEVGVVLAVGSQDAAA
jgi:hypothetical protein